jgi:SpoVK/Ycf46/Vps4 family AAA+-type ATPase
MRCLFLCLSLLFFPMFLRLFRQYAYANLNNWQIAIVFAIHYQYVGEGEKLMRTLFSLARSRQPTVLFFDEIDALMGARKDGEHEASRRLKTEFMVQVDGASTASEDRILVIGATNVPWDLDEAVLRRFPKRIYVPLPDEEARRGLIENMFAKHTAAASRHSGVFASISALLFSGKGSWILSSEEFDRLIFLTDGYSGSDLSAVCKEAAMGPVRELSSELLKTVRSEDMRPINFQDFQMALQVIRPSVSSSSLAIFTQWGSEFGATK